MRWGFLTLLLVGCTNSPESKQAAAEAGGRALDAVAAGAEAAANGNMITAAVTTVVGLGSAAILYFRRKRTLKKLAGGNP
jgi:hypothetical protein